MDDELLLDAAYRKLESLADEVTTWEIYLLRLAKRDELALPSDWKDKTGKEKTKWENAKTEVVRREIEKLRLSARRVDEYAKAIRHEDAESKEKISKKKATK